MNESSIGNSMRKKVLKCCVSQSPEGVLVSWPEDIRADGYIILKQTPFGEEEFVIDKLGITNSTKFVDKTLFSSDIQYKVFSYKNEITFEQETYSALIGSLEQSSIKASSKNIATKYIEDNYEVLLNLAKNLHHVDRLVAGKIVNDVWVSWYKREQQGAGFNSERISKSGITLTVDQAVENTIKLYAKNGEYQLKYNNKESKDGVEVGIFSVSMLEEREEGNSNNYIVGKASLATKSIQTDSPLEEMVDICTLEEDLEYVLKNTVDFKVSALSIFDNITELLDMISGEKEMSVVSDKDIKLLNKTLFSEYQTRADMVEMFGRILKFMNRNRTIFSEVYAKVVDKLDNNKHHTIGCF